MSARVNAPLKLINLDFTPAAQANMIEAGADVARDFAALRNGTATRDLLLAQLLNGADEDREQGWRDYVAEMARAAGVGDAAAPRFGVLALLDDDRTVRPARPAELAAFLEQARIVRVARGVLGEVLSVLDLSIVVDGRLMVVRDATIGAFVGLHFERGFDLERGICQLDGDGVARIEWHTQTVGTRLVDALPQIASGALRVLA